MKKTMIVSSLIIFAFAMVMNLQWAVKDGYGVKGKALHAQVLGQLNAAGTCKYQIINLGNTGWYTNPWTHGAKLKANNIYSTDSQFSIAYDILTQIVSATYSRPGEKSVIKIEYRCGWDWSGSCDLSKERDILIK